MGTILYGQVTAKEELGIIRVEMIKAQAVATGIRREYERALKHFFEGKLRKVLGAHCSEQYPVE